MNRHTGQAIGELEHISQSIADILTTRIGTRVMRREYGSQLPELIDQPFNGTTQLQLYAATAMALLRWEPRILLTRVQVFRSEQQGAFDLELDAVRADSNAALTLKIPLAFGGAA